MGAFKYAAGDSARAGKVEVVGQIVGETEKAILLSDGTRREWLPRSKVLIEKNRDGTVTVLMAEWLAKEKEFF